MMMHKPGNNCLFKLGIQNKYAKIMHLKNETLIIVFSAGYFCQNVFCAREAYLAKSHINIVTPFMSAIL